MFVFYSYFITFFVIILALLVILSKNPVSSIISLIGIYILTSILFLFWGAEFLSIFLIIVYVGAIAILFLFVVMMLNIRIVEIHKSLSNYSPIGFFIILFFFLEFFYITSTELTSFPVYSTELTEWGWSLYTRSNIYLMSEILFVLFITFIYYLQDWSYY